MEMFFFFPPPGRQRKVYNIKVVFEAIGFLSFRVKLEDFCEVGEESLKREKKKLVFSKPSGSDSAGTDHSGEKSGIKLYLTKRSGNKTFWIEDTKRFDYVK